MNFLLTDVGSAASIMQAQRSTKDHSLVPAAPVDVVENAMERQDCQHDVGCPSAAIPVASLSRLGDVPIMH